MGYSLKDSKVFKPTKKQLRLLNRLHAELDFFCNTSFSWWRKDKPIKKLKWQGAKNLYNPKYF